MSMDLVSPAREGEIPARATAAHAARPGELRSVLSRWDLTWQAVNIVVGASIFALPGVLIPEMGAWSVGAVVLAAVGILPSVLGFAEGAGRYREAGGAYRYVADAFGDYAGAQVGTLYWVVRITASAAVASVFVTYLGEIWPAATAQWPRAVILTALLGAAALINARGVRQTATTLNVMAVAKIVPLLLVSVAALFHLPPTLSVPPPPDVPTWVRAVLLWVFALGGLEATLIPASEAGNPQRDGPPALLGALALVAGLYTIVQLAMVALLGSHASDRPVADAAQLTLGRTGAWLVTAGALIATGGHVLGSTLASSRITFAMAQRGAVPKVLAYVSPAHRTPTASIALFAGCVWALALSGGFVWNAYLSAVARLLVYAATSAAVLRLRRRGPSAFTAPTAVHYGSIGFCLLLLAFQTRREAMAVVIVLTVGTLVWYGSSRWRHASVRGT